jgi:hypothetical protein
MFFKQGLQIVWPQLGRSKGIWLFPLKLLKQIGQVAIEEGTAGTINLLDLETSNDSCSADKSSSADKSNSAELDSTDLLYSWE